jgi:hypothetical protein
MAPKRKIADEAQAAGPETATAVPAQERQPGDEPEVKQYAKAPDPFGIAIDKLAGVRLFESKQDRQMAIKFGDGRPEDKPSQAVIDKLKEHGYRWQPENKIWAKPVRFQDAMQTRIEAERLYQEVTQMIREEKGIPAGKEAALPF